MISLFSKAVATKPMNSLTIREVFDFIRTPNEPLQQMIDDLRSAPTEELKKEKKRNLPAVSFSGQFAKRNQDGLTQHSGFYVYDYDDVGDVEKMKREIVATPIPSLVGAFVSPSGDGMKIILKGPVADSKIIHKNHWNIGANILRRALPYEIDVSGNNVDRLCFLSHDPQLFENDFYEPFGIENGAPEPVQDNVHDVHNEHDVSLDDFPAPVVAGPATLDGLRDLLWWIGSNYEYATWRNLIWGVVSKYGKKDDVITLLKQWSVECGGERGMKTKADEATFAAIVESEKEGVTFAFVAKVAREAGWKDWSASLRPNPTNGKIAVSDYNVDVVLTYHPELRGRFWKDEITTIEWMEPKKGSLFCPEGGALEETLALRLAVAFQAHLGAQIGERGAILLAMRAKAQQQTRNQRKEWLRSLKWDGTPRLKGLWTEGFGAEKNPLNEAAGLCWLTGAAARILKPGVDMQLVPILIGPQGRGKSTGLQALCPSWDWFHDGQVDMTGKAGYEVVRRATIVELSEVSAIRKHDVESVKAFVSARQFQYRAPYAKQAEIVQASWVFIGTSNKVEVLQDTTGNRRFLPIAVTGRHGGFAATIAWVKEHREQLWAEAVHGAQEGFQKGTTPWMLPPALWGEANLVADEARVRDLLEEDIETLTGNIDAAGKRVEMTMREILSAIGRDANEKSVELRAGDRLRKHGWEKIRKSRLLRVWVKKPPEL